MQTSGWRCCSCTNTYPVGDRPTDAGPCRLNDNNPGTSDVVNPPPAARQDELWLAELTGPGDNTTVLPGTGKRRLADDARNGVFKGIAKVNVNKGGEPAPFQARHRAGGS